MTPTINLKRLNELQDRRLSALLMGELTDTGAAYIVGHDLSQDLFRNTVDICRRIHSISSQEKQRLDVSSSRGSRGYFVAGDILNSTNPTICPDQSAGQMRRYASYEIGSESDAPFTVEQEILLAKNRWPTDSAIQQAIDDYIEQMLRVSMSLFGMFEKILHLPSTFFSERIVHPFYQLRLLSYPAVHINAKPRLGEHTDYECFTLLVQSDDGLEVRRRTGEWITLQAKPGSLIMLTGDLIEAVSDGRLPSSLHRVCTGSNERQSVVFFMGLDLDVEITTTVDMGYGDKLRVGDHLFARALENFPHLREQVESGQIAAPLTFGNGNPFRRSKVLDKRATHGKY